MNTTSLTILSRMHCLLITAWISFVFISKLLLVSVSHGAFKSDIPRSTLISYYQKNGGFRPF